MFVNRRPPKTRRDSIQHRRAPRVDTVRIREEVRAIREIPILLKERLNRNNKAVVIEKFVSRV